jgi:hypothetical protein
MEVQMHMAKRQDAGPLTRDHVTAWEREDLDAAMAAERSMPQRPWRLALSHPCDMTRIRA